MVDRTTKDRILDTAEELFATGGFTATSLRAITSEAGVNIAAVNYHFGSKEELIRAIFKRRIDPINRERLALLKSHRVFGSKPIPLEAVIESFIRPALSQASSSPNLERIVRLVGRLHAEPSDELDALFRQLFSRVGKEFIGALGAALPTLPPEELMWRFQFLIGVMIHTMTDGQRIKKISGGLCRVDDTEAMVRRMVPFIAAGMRAPVAKTAKAAR